MEGFVVVTFAALLRSCRVLQAIAAGQQDGLSMKMLAECVHLIAEKPVLPGYADMPVCLVELMQACTQFEEATRQSTKYVVCGP